LLTALGDLPNPQNFESRFSHVFFTEPTSGRNPAVPAEDLRDIFPADFGESYSIEKEPGLAVEMAANLAAKRQTKVLVLGSVYLVGDILKFVVKRSKLDLWNELTVH
jgi:folylpolyglutamate synthase/dihydropteroate synthase